MLRQSPISISNIDGVAGRSLRRNPVLNQIPLSIVQRAQEDPTRHADRVRLIAVKDDATGEVGLAVQTPPKQVALSATSEPIAEELGRVFTSHHLDVRRVHGPDMAARAFARGAGATGVGVVMEEGVFALHRVEPITPAVGAARLATDADATLLQSWVNAFSCEAIGEPIDDPAVGQRFGVSGRLWIWTDGNGVPVSMAYNSRRVEGWWSVSGVYTPPQFRGKRFATRLVAHLSRWALASGATGCTLFTDLKNPVSNRIYERIGYRRIGVHVALEW